MLLFWELWEGAASAHNSASHNCWARLDSQFQDWLWLYSGVTLGGKVPEYQRELMRTSLMSLRIEEGVFLGTEVLSGVSWSAGNKMALKHTERIRNRSTIWSNNFTSEIESRISERYLHTHVCTIYIIHNSQIWKQPKCPPTCEWINKIWSIHTLEYYSAIKREEILRYAAIQVNLQCNRLNEISQLQKMMTNILWLHSCNVPRVQFRDRRHDGCQELGVSDLQDGCTWSYNNVNELNTTEIYTLK